MPQFIVDDDVAALVERLAKKKPFEELSFNDALRRIFQVEGTAKITPDAFPQTEVNAHKKAPTPSPEEWVAGVADLKGKKGLHTWKAICVLLKIDTAGDSARRRLKNWVKVNRHNWPAVPDID